MFELSDKASEIIKETFKDREAIPSIRICFSEGG